MERTVVNNIAVQLAYLPGVDRTTYQNPQPLSTPGEYHELFQAVFGPEFPVGDTYDVVINDLFGGAPGASPGLFDEVMGLTFSPFGVETGVYTHGRTVFTALLSQINSETLSDAQITALDTSTDYINGLQSNIDSLLELDNRDTTLLDVVNMSHGLGVNIEALATILEIEDLTTANINDYQAVIFEKLLDLPLDAWKSLYRSPTGKPIEDIDYATIPSILRDLDYLVNYDGNNQLLDKPDTIVVVATPNASEGAINLLSLVPNVVTASGLTHDGELHSFAAPSSLSDAFAPFELVPSTLSDEQGNVTHFKLGNYTAPIEQTTAGQFNGQSVQDVLASEADYELLNHFINRQLDSSDPTAYEDAINKLSESVFSVEELFDRHILGLLQIRAIPPHAGTYVPGATLLSTPWRDGRDVYTAVSTYTLDQDEQLVFQGQVTPEQLAFKKMSGNSIVAPQVAAEAIHWLQTINASDSLSLERQGPATEALPTPLPQDGVE